MQIVFLYLGKYSKNLEIWIRYTHIRLGILIMDLKRLEGEFLFGFVISLLGNPVSGSWRDTDLSRRERLKKKESPKGLPRKEWWHYLKTNYSVGTAIVYSITPYLRIFIRR